MSTQSAILALRAAGLTDAQVGRYLGRDSSLVSQIARGMKPGRNLTEAAEALQARVAALGPAGAASEGAPLPEAPRRVQRVRQAIRRGGDRWSTATVKEGGTKSGAKALDGFVADAAAAGRRLSMTLTVDPSVSFNQSGGRVPPKAKRRRRAQEAHVGASGRGIDAAALDRLVGLHGGNVTEAVAAWLNESGTAPGVTAGQLYGITLSSWDA